VETGAGYVVRSVGRVESSLRHREHAPMQGSEGAPEAWIVFEDDAHEAMRDLCPGDRLVVLTWLHEADRETQLVHPRDDTSAPETGVFSTRSADRPNPIGLHQVEVVEVDGLRVRVGPLEAIEGTPVIDVKPVIRSDYCS
jgi:tRNA-Thr(GGU) m(6)t(6)A37 methyltransferase TsaA